MQDPETPNLAAFVVIACGVAAGVLAAMIVGRAVQWAWLLFMGPT